MICRVLPHESRSGPANMALDHALLDAVDADPSAAVLRTYSWDEPTLSLGYFQAVAEADADPRWRGVPRVRRPSGGGALWHDREVTYALIVPRSHPLAARPSDLYRAVHAAIASILRGLGIDARSRGRAGAEVSKHGPFLCFLDEDPEDILLGASKVVGSAQRRRPRAVLQHGSLLLRRSPVTPELPGLADLGGPDCGVSAWALAIGSALPGALAMIGEDDRLRDREMLAAIELECMVYSRTEWTRRR